MNDQKHKKGNLLGYGIAMAIGATMGLVFAPKSGEELRNETAAKAKVLAQKFRKTRLEIAETIKEIFGEVNEELEKDYLEIRGDLMATVEELREKGELTKEKYEEMIDELVNQFGKAHRWSRTAIRKLIKNLADEWNAIKP